MKVNAVVSVKEIYMIIPAGTSMINLYNRYKIKYH